MKWFLSYAYTVQCEGGSNGERHVHFGCATYEGEEHPIVKVARWNVEYPGRKHVLLAFEELDPATPLPELSSVIG